LRKEKRQGKKADKLRFINKLRQSSGEKIEKGIEGRKETWKRVKGKKGQFVYFIFH